MKDIIVFIENKKQEFARLPLFEFIANKNIHPKQRLIFAVSLFNVRSKFLTKLLHRSIHALERSIIHRVATGTNPTLPWAAFWALVGLGAS